LLDKLKPAPSLAEMAQKRFLTMNLKPLTVLKPVFAREGTPKVCAIPLLNALPATSSGDFKIQVYKPAATVDPMPSAAGIPACK
jgi:hypothetical protein